VNFSGWIPSEFQHFLADLVEANSVKLENDQFIELLRNSGGLSGDLNGGKAESLLSICWHIE
jgi:hypothetical protein